MPEGSFWLRVMDETGETIATHAEALFQTDDFMRLIESRELWHPNGIPVPPGIEPPTIMRPPVELAGKIGYGGSMWVSEAHRKRGLSMYLPYLSRALFMRNYETDYHTGIVLNGLGLATVPRQGYGFAHVEPCLTGWFAPSGRHAAAYLCYMDQQEALEQFRKLPQHSAHPIPLRRPAPDRATG